MKSTVESLSPTRVRLNVEVPFGDLTPDVDKAYRKVAGQVRIQGFRRGKVPPQIIDARVGRAAVLEEAVQEAVPRLYADAVREHDVRVLGQPSVDVTDFVDGDHLNFTAEVDVRPEMTLPAYDSLSVTVDDAEVTDEQVDEQLGALRDRFAVLGGVDRAVQTGDFVSLDLAATVDGEDFPGASTTGLSYEVGTNQLVPGIDDVLVGMSSGETKTFTTQLVAGEHEGKDAEVSVTVRSVKEKQVPDLDDDFAQDASEFETIDELRADVRQRLTRVRRLEQGSDARDKVVEALVAAVDPPVPDDLVAAEEQWRRRTIEDQLSSAGLSLRAYLASDGRTEEDFAAELHESTLAGVRSQLVLDAVADKEELGITDAEITDVVVRRAQQAGVDPNLYAREVTRSGQLGALVAEVRRAKATALVLEAATVTDASGRPVDLAALRPEVESLSEAESPSEAESLSEAEFLSEAETPTEVETPSG